MLTKELFVRQIELIKKFEKIISKLEELDINIVDSSLYNIPLEIFDHFIDSYFSEEGKDIIYWWLWEGVPKVIYFNSIFGKEEINLETAEDLWKILDSEKELYFK